MFVRPAHRDATFAFGGGYLIECLKPFFRFQSTPGFEGQQP
jgi:hypothetical protein